MIRIKCYKKILAGLTIVLLSAPFGSVGLAASVAPAVPKVPVNSVNQEAAPVAPKSPVSPNQSAEQKNASTPAVVEVSPASNKEPISLITDPAPTGFVAAGVLGVSNGEPLASLDQEAANEVGLPVGSKFGGEALATQISSDSKADLVNDIDGVSNTGGNSASYNTGDGSVTTGDSNLVLNFLNLINTNFVMLPGGSLLFIYKNIFSNLVGDYILDPVSGEYYSDTGSRVVVENKETGAESVNNASAEATRTVEIDNQNIATVVNDIDLMSTTGGNKANANTGSGTVVTGDANLSLSLINLINTNWTVSASSIIGVINIFGDWVGDLLTPGSILRELYSGSNGLNAKNSTTGASSVNKADLNATEGLEVVNNNFLTADNNIVANANTGGNTASYDTQSGGVATGQSEASIKVDNYGNQNFLGGSLFNVLVNVFGSWNGGILASLAPFTSAMQADGVTQILLSNINTGVGSTNNVGLEQENTLELENNNQANLINDVNVAADSGGNSASYNTGSGSVSTGNANLAVNIANFLNMNFLGERVVYLFINVFGDWRGNITVEGATPNKTVKESISEKVIKIVKSETFSNSYHEWNVIEITDNPIKMVIERNVNTVLAAASKDAGTSQAVANDSSISFFEKHLATILFALFAIYVSAIIGYRNYKKSQI